MKRQISSIIMVAFIIAVCGCFCIDGSYSAFQKCAGKVFYPGLMYVAKGEKEIPWSEKLVENFWPLYEYVNAYAPGKAKVEDNLTYEMILAEQARDEERISEDLSTNPEVTTQVQVSNDALALDKLRDFNYLLSNFYTVDSTTTIDQNQLNVDDLLSRNMKLQTGVSGPKVLIFHTHSQETFADSTPGDVNTSIVGMGKYLTERLKENGIETLHHDGVYDLINGKLDRSKAYEMAGVAVKEILNQNPSIEVVIDLHRDGVPESTHLVTEINGKKVAKIMFFNGLSRTKTNGNLTSLPNPYIQDNLSFSFQMQMASQKLYPGLARRIYLKGYRYNLHLMPKSLLIEAGAQTNTVEELKNAMELLAKILSEVLL